ncbi:DUF5374 domain-containing protein [Pasteurella testudinis]|nr:DUF5374 domain-containing protein [Pasteurella testudinis]
MRYKRRYKPIYAHGKKGASLLGVLVTLALFSLVMTGISRWVNLQQRDGLLTYQRYQALLLAQNQFARQRLGLACETRSEQNQQVFRLNCQGKQVKVRFATGEITLNAESE